MPDEAPVIITTLLVQYAIGQLRHDLQDFSGFTNLEKS
jgi:hypothetical protein